MERGKENEGEERKGGSKQLIVNFLGVPLLCLTLRVFCHRTPTTSTLKIRNHYAARDPIRCICLRTIWQVKQNLRPLIRRLMKAVRSQLLENMLADPKGFGMEGTDVRIPSSLKALRRIQ